VVRSHERLDPGQITTKDGKLSILMENVENHELHMETGILAGVRTMENLGRPGYGGTADGVWPYTYDSSEVGTFRNQTLKDDSGSAPSLHSDASKEKYNFQLSVPTSLVSFECKVGRIHSPLDHMTKL